jgi:hypothetical protein
VYIAEVAKAIVEEQSPEQIMKLRAKLYELIVHCIPTAVIMKVCPACCLHPQYLLLGGSHYLLANHCKL